MFLYADGRIQWTTGDNSGGFRGLYGTEALAGINAGDGENFETVPGSRTSGIINVQETSNIGIPGMWMFQINKGAYVHTVGVACCNCKIARHKLSDKKK